MSTETVVVMATKPNDAKTIEARDTKIISQNYENLRIQSGNTEAGILCAK